MNDKPYQGMHVRQAKSPDLSGDDPLNIKTAEEILARHGGRVVLEDVPLPRKIEREYAQQGKANPKSWFLVDDYGSMSLQGGSEEDAKVTGALLLYLWERGVEVSLARDLACSYMDRRIGREPRK